MELANSAEVGNAASLLRPDLFRDVLINRYAKAHR